MKIQIMGAGALGSLFGYFLLKGGYDVIFVARGEQYRALKERGLRVTGIEEYEDEVYVTRRPENSDLVFLTVKAYDTLEASKMLRDVRFDAVCSLQNGVGNEEILAEFFENVVGAITTYGANLAEPGKVVYAGKGKTVLGNYKGDYAQVFFEVLSNSGVDAEIVNDIEEKIWEKAAINAVINPITAICRFNNGKVVEIPEIWEIAKRTAAECQEILMKMGYRVDIVKTVKEVALKTSENRSSMLQDIEKGRKTEVEFINGAFVRKGGEVGVDAHYNRTLLSLIRGIEFGLD